MSDESNTATAQERIFEDLYLQMGKDMIAAMEANPYPFPPSPPLTRWQRFGRAVKRQVVRPWHAIQRALRWAGGCNCDGDCR